MWRPDFPYAERAEASVSGYHRAFCIASTVHRGTRQRPGLVLGLDRGGACCGMAYRVAAAEAPGVLTYLRKRELVYGVYRETHVPATLAPGASVSSVHVLAYTVERCHPSYTGRLTLSIQAEIIRGARGQSGANLDYLINTVRHLSDLGIRERHLERLMAIAGGFAANTGRDVPQRPSVAGLRSTWARRPARNLPLPLGDQRRFGHRITMIGT
jgi:cation transport protein ChaC